MERHSRESGQIMGVGEKKSHKSNSNSKRSQQGSKGTGPHESLEILPIASQQAWKKEQSVGKLSSVLETSCRWDFNFCEPSCYFPVATYVTRKTQSGLFSAMVAALLAVTIPDLKPNAQDTSAFYLENIFKLFANPNSSNASIPSALARPPVFLSAEICHLGELTLVVGPAHQSLRSHIGDVRAALRTQTYLDH